MQDEIEDDDFDLAAVLAEYERQASTTQPPTMAADDDWEEVTLG